MKLAIVSMLAAVSLTATSLGETAPDLNDSVLVGYQLSTYELVQYNPAGTTLAPFLDRWDYYNAAGLSRDYLFMASDNPQYVWNENAGVSFTGHDDAQITVRLAYSNNGAYFYIKVEDNIWTPYTSWATDCAEIYLDIIPLTQQTSDGWFNPTQWALSPSSKQIQLPFGGSTPAQINIRMYDSATATMKDNLIDNNSAKYDALNWKLVSIDAVHKALELFIPWSQWGMSMPPPNTQSVCFTVGYNDVDDGNPADVKSLHWRGLCDPYCGPNVATWGQIEFGHALECSCGAPPPPAVKSPLVRNHHIPRSVVSTELYSLRGDKIGNSMTSMAGLVIARQTLKDGSGISAVGFNR
jgi:hypothetical protein